jgi:hypothetical protein
MLLIGCTSTNLTSDSSQTSKQDSSTQEQSGQTFHYLIQEENSSYIALEDLKSNDTITLQVGFILSNDTDEHLHADFDATLYHLRTKEQYMHLAGTVQVLPNSKAIWRQPFTVSQDFDISDLAMDVSFKNAYEQTENSSVLSVKNFKTQSLEEQENNVLEYSMQLENTSDQELVPSVSLVFTKEGNIVYIHDCVFSQEKIEAGSSLPVSEQIELPNDFNGTVIDYDEVYYLSNARSD